MNVGQTKVEEGNLTWDKFRGRFLVYRELSVILEAKLFPTFLRQNSWTQVITRSSTCYRALWTIKVNFVVKRLGAVALNYLYRNQPQVTSFIIASFLYAVYFPGTECPGFMANFKYLTLRTRGTSGRRHGADKSGWFTKVVTPAPKNPTPYPGSLRLSTQLLMFCPWSVSFQPTFLAWESMSFVYLSCQRYESIHTFLTWFWKISKPPLYPAYYKLVEISRQLPYCDR
jgi:hypothetical protein